MQVRYASKLINTAWGCRAKTEALRQEARLLSRTVSTAKRLEIATHWDQLAADYERADAVPNLPRIME